MYHRRLLVFCATLATAAILFMPGCKKENLTQVKEAVTGDLFPLVVSHKLNFTGYIRQAVADTNITATGAFYIGRMTVVSNSVTTPVGGTSHLISDSSFVNPSPATWVASGFYVKRTTSTSGDFTFLTNAGRFYRSFGINRTDSLKWVLLVKEGALIGEPWVAFDSSYTGSTGAVRLRIEGNFEAKENVSTPAGSIQTYKLVATRKIYLGANTTPSVQGPTATLWLAPGIGIIKFIFNSDGETPGFERNYQSRNF